MSNMVKAHSPDIRSILRTRLDLLRTLRELSAEQLDLIRQERVDEVGCVVDIKEAVIVRLKHWESSHTSLVRDWAQIEEDFSPVERAECAGIQRRAAAELDQLKKTEGESRLELAARRDSASKDLATIARSLQTVSAYESVCEVSSRLAFDVNQ